MRRIEQTLYQAEVSSISVTLLVAGAALAILMWSNTAGPGGSFGPRSMPRANVLGLWLSPDPGGDSGAARESWRSAASPDSAIVESGSLQTLIDGGATVIVVVNGRRLMRGPANTLLEFARRGGGVVLTGSVGVRDQAGGWRGYDLMREMLDVRHVWPLPRILSGVLRAESRGPIASRLDPGERIRLLQEDGVPAIGAGSGELRWSCAAASTDDPGRKASLRRRVGSGRLVWLGVGPAQSADAPGDPWSATGRLLGSAIRWASGEPAAEVLPADDHRQGLVDVCNADTARLAAWRGLRAAIATSVQEVGPGRLRVAATNRSEATRSAVVRVHANRDVSGLDVEVTKILQNAPAVQHVASRSWFDLELRDIEPGESLAVHVDIRSEEQPLAVR